jgi:hypothetical protein
MIRTVSKKTWDIKASLIEVGNDKLSESTQIRFEP